MISSEAQRTLVKSPPELWAEISDPESLARHLGEFGEIRITRIQPEQKVEWEGDRASGTVVIKPSGWGTKVKLTVTREPAIDADDAAAPDDGDRPGTVLAAPAPPTGSAPKIAPEIKPAIDGTAETERETAAESAPEAAAAAEPEPAGEQSPPGVEFDLSSAPDAAVIAAPTSAVDAEIEVEPQPEPAEQARHVSEPVARRGFFARLFARRRSAVPEPPAVPTPEVERDDAHEPLSREPVAEKPVAEKPESGEVIAEEPVAEEPIADEMPAADLSAEKLTADEPTADASTADEPTGEEPAAIESARLEPAADDEPPRDLAGELAAAEEVTAEQVQSVLTGVLDRLGAAHHRPFSRS